MEITRYLIKTPDGVRIASDKIIAYWYNEEIKKTHIDTGAEECYSADGDQTTELDKLMKFSGYNLVALHAPKENER